MAKNDWEHDDFDIFELYTMYIKKLRQFFYRIYPLTCLNIHVKIHQFC